MSALSSPGHWRNSDFTMLLRSHPDVEAETPILWPPDVKSWLIWKDPDAGKHWGQEEKGTTEDELVWWHHWHNGHGLGWTLGVGDGQGGLAYCGSWGGKESDMTEQLNWTDKIPSRPQVYFTQDFLHHQTLPCLQCLTRLCSVLTLNHSFLWFSS